MYCPSCHNDYFDGVICSWCGYDLCDIKSKKENIN